MSSTIKEKNYWRNYAKSLSVNSTHTHTKKNTWSVCCDLPHYYIGDVKGAGNGSHCWTICGQSWLDKRNFWTPITFPKTQLHTREKILTYSQSQLGHISSRTGWFDVLLRLALVVWVRKEETCLLPARGRELRIRGECGQGLEMGLRCGN